MQALRNKTPDQIRREVDQQEKEKKEEEPNKKGAKWATSVFNAFQEGYGPKDYEMPARFGYYMAVESRCLLSSIETLLYSLQNSNIFTRSERRRSLKAAKKGIKDGKRLYPREKNPCSSEDMKKILESIPKDWDNYIETCCCIALAGECGCRAISAVHVKKEDISFLSGGECRVILDYGKGRRHWRHTITLSKDSMCAKYMRLLERDINVSEDTINKRFQRACELSGFPDKYFSFHR